MVVAWYSWNPYRGSGTDIVKEIVRVSAGRVRTGQRLTAIVVKGRLYRALPKVHHRADGLVIAVSGKGRFIDHDPLVAPATAGDRVFKRPEIKTTAGLQSHHALGLRTRTQDRSEIAHQIGIDFRGRHVLGREPGACLALQKALFDPSLGKLGLTEPATAAKRLEPMSMERAVGGRLTGVQTANRNLQGTERIAIAPWACRSKSW